MSEVCGYVTARAEDGPCQTCGHPLVYDYDWGRWFHVDFKEDGASFDHEPILATRCETCGGSGRRILKASPLRVIDEHWLDEPCPDCVLGLVQVAHCGPSTSQRFSPCTVSFHPSTPK